MQWLPCAAAGDVGVTTARFGHSAVCISGAGSVWGTDLVVVFGGVSYNDGDAATEHHAALSDVVVLQADADLWFSPQVSSSDDDAPAALTRDGGHEGGGPLPDARAFHAAAAVERRMYVFGGHVLSYDPDQNKKRRRFFNDLWCLDTDTWTWQRLEAAGPEVPARRDMATLTRAGPACLLLFGGRLESGRVAGDAWVLDLNSMAWSQLRLPAPTPPPRKMHAAVYATNRVVLFGGERDAGVLDDLWTLKGADGSEPAKWTQIKLRPAPSGRFGHGMAACGSRLAVFGGCLDQSSILSFSRTYVQCNELWVLDMATFSWHRVEPPEGATIVSGAALEDPHLQQQLQAQQQQQALGDPKAAAAAAHAASAPLLLLPVERMCHSLVAAGPDKLLLVGGRKRDGICGESWWLFMGPDNLTPALTPPSPAAAAAALRTGLHAPPRSGGQPATAHHPPPHAPHARAQGGAVVPPAASAAAPQTQQLPSPTAAAAGTPSLLQNLLRKTPPPDAAAGVAGTHAAAASSAAAQQQRPQVAAAPPQPQPHGKQEARLSVSGLESAGAAALPVLPYSPGSVVHASKSAGSLLEPLGSSPAGSPAQGGQLLGAAGRESIADKASTALNRLTNKVSNLLTPGKDGSAPSPGAGPGSGGPPAAAPPGVGLLARLRQSNSGQAVGAGPPGAAVLQGQAQPQPQRMAGTGSSYAAPPAPADELRGPLDELRARLGLPPLGAPPPHRGPPSAALPTCFPTLDLADPTPCLAALGRQLTDGSDAAAWGAPTPPAARPGASAAAVSRARQHLACSAGEHLRVGHLPLLLSDCQALLRQRGAASWAQLEAESRVSGGGGEGGGGEGAPPPPDLAVLLSFVSACSHPLSDLRAEELRLGDVPELLGVYRSMVLGTGFGVEGAEGGGGGVLLGRG